MTRRQRRPFWDNVDRSGGPDACWPWLGGRSPKGYGNTMRKVDGGSVAGSHRIAWVLTNGPIPPRLFVCHRCDNPPCCNPKHLWLGTGSDNQRDAIAKGRKTFEWLAALPRGERGRWAPKEPTR